MALFFWICSGIIVYTFIGYGALLFLLVKAKRLFYKKVQNKIELETLSLPSCSVLIAAYNEEEFISQKILNTLSLNYPSEQLKIFIVADGSTDKTPEIINSYPQVNLLYNRSRKGKVHAINRAMQLIDSDIVVFTDANTFLNKNALIHICKNYADPKIGGVAGEKRIFIGEEADASTAGESLYWRYESKLKQWDSELNTTIGAAGELFSIKRNLYESVPESTILDDFIISMKIVKNGYRIIYEPNAFAFETSSSNIQEELKRKVRIATGGIQSILALKSLFNFIKHPFLSFQYVSHRVLRWSITPFLLVIVFVLNILLAIETSQIIYKSLCIAQTMFYFLAIFGLILEKKELRLKVTFVPYYFCVMNYSIIAGIFKYLKKEQSSVWDKAERKESMQEDIISLNQHQV